MPAAAVVFLSKEPAVLAIAGEGQVGPYVPSLGMYIPPTSPAPRGISSIMLSTGFSLLCVHAWRVRMCVCVFVVYYTMKH